MQNTLRTVFFLVIFLVAASDLEANTPPPNDSVQNAANLGLLPLPGACPGNPVGDSAMVLGSTQNAGYNPADFSVNSCYTSPSPDVWYRFRSSGSFVYVEMHGFSGLNTFYVRLLHSQGSALSLVPMNCATSVSNTIIVSFPTPDINGEYYLQMGGATQSEEGDFSLKLKAFNDCNGCVKHGTVELTPAPAFGKYNEGDTVQMCTTVTRWETLASSYLHSIVPVFGPDWDTTTLTPTVTPGNPSTSLHWIWASSATPSGTHRGFFFDANGDNNPSNNAGDNGGPLTTWTGCWKIRTKTQCSTNDLSVDVHLYSDAETGNGNASFVCNPYNAIHISTAMNCCQAPTLAVSNTSCVNGNGVITVNSNGFVTGHTFNLTLLDTAFNTIATQSNVMLPTNFTNLFTGHYLVQAVDVTASGCASYLEATILPAISITVHQTAIGCTSGSGQALVTINNPTVTSYVYNWINVSASNQNDSVAFNLPDGWVSVTVTDQTGNCSATDSVLITHEPSPDATFNLPNSAICITADSIPLSGAPATPGGTFGLVSPTTGGITVNATSGTVFLNNTTLTPPFYIYEKYSVGLNCSSTFIDSVLIMGPPTPPVPNGSTSITWCIGASVPVLGVSVPNFTVPVWYDLQTSGSGFGGSYTPPLNASTTPGTYTYAAVTVPTANTSCVSAPIYFVINAVAPPVIATSNDTTICQGEIANMSVGGCSNCAYVWSPAPTFGSATSASVQTSPSATTSYTVIATDPNGCSATEYCDVFVNGSGTCFLHVYSGLTPNGDGKNDMWVIDGIDQLPAPTVSIFNRWGQLVWEESNYDNNSVIWKGEDKNGNKLPDGTYYYVITSIEGKLNGWVELSH